MLAAAAGQAMAQQDGELRLVDLTNDFDQSWNETASLPDATRPVEFEARFAKILPGFYDAKRVANYLDEAKYQAMVLKGLKAYSDNRVGIQRVSREFSTLIGPALGSFEAQFGPMRGYPPVYLVVSFGEFDGGTRSLPEGQRLLFGADVIDRIYQNTPIQPFFHHELFHLYHGRKFQQCEQLWCSLWTEGLAVHVATALNPGADDKSLLLTSPVPLREAVEANRTAAVCAVRSRLNSTDSADYAPLFMGGGKGLAPGLPPRFGYYVGLLVAHDLGKTRSLKELAEMNGEPLRAEIEASLKQMAECPA
jgi:hypothetical protein